MWLCVVRRVPVTLERSYCQRTEGPCDSRPAELGWPQSQHGAPSTHFGRCIGSRAVSGQNDFRDSSACLGGRITVPDGEMGLRKGKGSSRHPSRLGASDGLGWGAGGAPYAQGGTHPLL